MAAPLLGLFATGYGAASRARVRTEAAFLAREKMEEVKSAGYWEAGCGFEERVGGHEAYSRRVAVTVPPGAEGLALKQVCVTVEWPENGVLREMQLITYLCGR